MLLAALLALLCFTGCGKDDDDDGTANEFVLGGSSTALDWAYTENYGEDAGVYNIDLFLLGDGFTKHSTGSLIDSISGSGPAVYLEMFTSNATLLETGTYTFTQDEMARTFDFGFTATNLDIAGSAGTYNFITGGTVEIISMSNTNCEVEFNLTTAAGEVTGYYNGSIDTQQ